MGSLNFSLGKVQYDNLGLTTFPLEAQVGVGVGASIVALIVLIIVLIYRFVDLINIISFVAPSNVMFFLGILHLHCNMHCRTIIVCVVRTVTFLVVSRSGSVSVSLTPTVDPDSHCWEFIGSNYTSQAFHSFFFLLTGVNPL